MSEANTNLSGLPPDENHGPAALPQADSLAKRYFYKLSANLVVFVVNIFIYSIIPRGLGPKAYGNYGFLNNFFTQVIGFLNLGTSTAFYTKLSRRPDEKHLAPFYLYFVGLASLLLIGFVTAVYLAGMKNLIWPDQRTSIIYLAAGFGILTWLSQVTTGMTDAFGLTVAAEKARMTQRLLALVLAVLLFAAEWLNLVNFFLYQWLILLFFIGACLWIMGKYGRSLRQGWIVPRPLVRRYTREFYDFSHPLFFIALVGMIEGIYDRWLLQMFGGSFQQGLFTLSFQIAAICLMFTSAMSPLLLREFSVSFGNKDFARMADMFRRYVPLMFSIASYFSCFIAVEASKVVYLIGGSSFTDAIPAVHLMSFYPVHQTYGQLSGSLFYATEQTGLYRNIGIAFMLIGMPLTYLLLAPAEKYGFDLGVNGLAWKMVLVNAIAVNVQLYFNTRLLKLKFWKYLAHQGICLGSLVCVALAATRLTDFLLGSSVSVILSLLTAGTFYTTLVLGLLFLLPRVFGIHESDMAALRTRVKIWLHRSRKV